MYYFKFTTHIKKELNSTYWYLFSNFKNPNIANQNKIAQIQRSLVYPLKTT